ncbi:hypothetical protein OROHE_002701 [Orobanche hederae]
MSQPPPQLDQLVMYPNPVVIGQPESSSSDGSFRHVYVVLAVIAGIAVVGYVLGRLFNKGHRRAKEGPHKPSKPSKQSHQEPWNPEWSSRYQRYDSTDIELGRKDYSKGANKNQVGKIKPGKKNSKPAKKTGGGKGKADIQIEFC